MIQPWADSPMEAILRKEWREHQWKLYLAVAVLPVYHLNFILLGGEGTSAIAWFFTAFVGALFGSDIISFSKSSAHVDPMSVLPVRRMTVMAVRMGLGIALVVGTGIIIFGMFGLVRMTRGALIFAKADQLYGFGVRSSFELISLYAQLSFVLFAGSFLSLLISAVTGSSFLGFIAGGFIGSAVAVGGRGSVLVGSARLDTGTLLILGGILVAFPLMKSVARFVLDMARVVSSRLIMALPAPSLTHKELAEMSGVFVIGLACALLCWVTRNAFLIMAAALPIPLWIGASRVAGERDRGTLNALYALPASPSDIIRGKYYAGTLAVIAASCVMELPLLTANPKLSIPVACILFPAAVYVLFNLSFLISLAAPSTTQALGGLAIILSLLLSTLYHPVLALVALIVLIYVAGMSTQLWEEMQIWWPRFGLADPAAAPWKRLVIPALIILGTPTVLAWWTWGRFLSSDAVVFHASHHHEDIRGIRTYMSGDDLAVVKKSGETELRRVVNIRVVQNVLAADPPRHSDDRNEVERHLEIAGQVRGEMALPRDMRNESAWSGEYSALMKVRRADGDHAEAGELMYEIDWGTSGGFGPPPPAMNVSYRAHSHGEWLLIGMMSWPEEMRLSKAMQYRDITVDPFHGKLFLLGDEGMTEVDLSGMADKLRSMNLEMSPQQEEVSGEHATPWWERNRVENPRRSSSLRINPDNGELESVDSSDTGG